MNSNFKDSEEKYFDRIYNRVFSEYYVIDKDVSASLIDPKAHPACKPISFLFREKDGKPVLAVILVTPNNYKGMNILGTMKVCEQAGIRWVRFFRGWRNEETYVINRTREYLQ